MSAADIGGLQTFPTELQTREAWLEARVALDELTPVRSSFIYGVESLPVRFEHAGQSDHE
ncbi:hypothetical protein SY89_03306 [Halolamina pelagica]|uniref:Uncharacterized protein n=1 Tax=Halolamina pelagica TaxID=699431 RepID=A0A0P7FRB1_9EURY|nr:hypothetical protein [Halolamina pelagica]KPN29072.1 hypothetical protein SY89_03306 [Halolamina pelagica]